ncbi:MAG: hypothetical protein ACLUI3_16885 [Christensenellales bacterium]
MAATAPGAQSWQTSTQDYNAGYPCVFDGQRRERFAGALTELGYYTTMIDGKYSTGRAP